ncbi:MAG: FAD-dependent oxidoreductase [Myxococcota bacterium]|nr:FAD-dependent oxidoreductase [Myxococcota bacterium]
MARETTRPVRRAPRIAVVGGGIAGLTAATLAAREVGAEASVDLFESVSEWGGRARTREDEGFHFNMGPHALYQDGPAEAVLAELGVAPEGSPPDISRGLAWCEGRAQVFPAGAASLISTTLLSAGEKLRLGRKLAGLSKLDAAPWDGRSLRDFLEATFPTKRLRCVFEAVVRLSTYAHAPEQLSAGTAIRQVQGALGGGVRYLDGGWQPMVDAIAAKAREAGANLHAGARARTLEPVGSDSGSGRPDSGWRVGFGEGRSEEFDAVVLAMGPSEINGLFGGSDPTFAEWAERSLPVRAACFEIGLSRLPDPRRPFALGIDEPTYLSVHSLSARGLAPEGGALIHAARYLAPDEKPERAELEEQLGRQLDALQPGWRDHVVTKKVLADLRVAHAVPTAAMGGLAGRPGVRVAHRPGLYVAGDWVGDTGWLVDASFASGREAARAVARDGVQGGSNGEVRGG